MINELLDDAVKAAESRKLHVKQIAVRQKGELIAHYLFEPEDRPDVWSVSKTFTSIAVGLAVSEGLFSLDSRFSDYFSEYGSKSEITVSDALSLKTGHSECPVSRAWGAGQKTGDIMKRFFEERETWPHGTHWYYDNSGWYMLSRMVEKTSGMNLRDFLVPRLFEPLGIDTPKWELCDLGHTLGLAGLHLNAGEIARVGEVIMHDGEGIIPEDYVREMKKVKTDNSMNTQKFATKDHLSGYGYGLWMCRYPGTYRMDGAFGNYCVMLPGKDAVVCLVSNEPEHMSGVLDLVWDTIFDKLLRI